MLTNAQKGLLKRAQSQAGLDDAAYRRALSDCVPGCTTSTDPRLGDDHLDILMAYFEAIHWRAVKAGTLQPSCNASAPFRQPGYWAAKNPAHNTSRDRWTGHQLEDDIARLERELSEDGCSPAYIAAIDRNVRRGTNGQWTPPQMRAYRSALDRTLRARQKKAGVTTAQPF